MMNRARLSTHFLVFRKKSKRGVLHRNTSANEGSSVKSDFAKDPLPRVHIFFFTRTVDQIRKMKKKKLHRSPGPLTQGTPRTMR
ncbi:hypothetical protein POVWA2_087610 [Plasmodium ovale wallikeri]|uniref:Uncharacterized protein n=1 Tax=Plasmodium ovale wallikeri TaxID=864142 RepID=A0A1A8YJZ2_PLAOA|nr:hypothetical protein POVWA1_009130 [Plasmodium ovale wallikeri]SBT58774.1 hypothetical protein POVWA2_087610 [Plasmodium ovale wallikeri]